MDLIAALPKALRQWGSEYLRRRGFGPTFTRDRVDEIWIDVGAHLGLTPRRSTGRDPVKWSNGDA